MARPALVGKDLTPASEGALARAIDLAREKDSELVIMYVYAPRTTIRRASPIVRTGKR
jgi:nucleotide-binding universal stress UspA family protein